MTRSSRRLGEPDPDEEEHKEEEEEEVKEEEEEKEEQVKEEENEEEPPSPEPVATEKENKVSPSPAVASPDYDDGLSQDPKVAEEQEIIKSTEPKTDLEIALTETLKRREAHIERLTGEVTKLKSFISKRKQTYKRKRKEEGAPTRALSAYNIFVQDRFSRLAKENEQALKSADSEAVLKRVPPASLVASTGNEWKKLSAEEKSHYEERAREDRKRYEEQMAKYQPPDKQSNRKRNKTGYNMFFSAHVLRLKQTESGVPSERGSVARLVGNAWKQLSAEDKQYYEREADKQNGMNPVKDDDDEDDEEKRQMGDYMHPAPHEMHMQGGYPGMAPGAGGMHQAPQHDPRYAPYPGHHMGYGQAPYQGQPDYGAQGRYHQPPAGGRHAYPQGYPPRHPYDNSGMGI